ncbi:MAG: nucleotidyltransferase domain-containing protein, partial [Spirulinaceae cyanobacterium]
MSSPTTVRTIEDLRNDRNKLIGIFAKHGVYSVWIFGSVARGEATDKSDIDFLIDYDRKRTSAW